MNLKINLHWLIFNVFGKLFVFPVGEAAASDDPWAMVQGEQSAFGAHAVACGEDVPLHLRGLPRGPHRQTHSAQGRPELHVYAAQVRADQLKISTQTQGVV